MKLRSRFYCLIHYIRVSGWWLWRVIVFYLSHFCSKLRRNKHISDKKLLISCVRRMEQQEVINEPRQTSTKYTNNVWWKKSRICPLIWIRTKSFMEICSVGLCSSADKPTNKQSGGNRTSLNQNEHKENKENSVQFNVKTLLFLIKATWWVLNTVLWTTCSHSEDRISVVLSHQQLSRIRTHSADTN